MVGRVGMEGVVEKRRHFSGNEPCQASISREGKIETSNKSTDNPFKMEGWRSLNSSRERKRECVCVCECEYIPLDWWIVSMISDEVFIGDFIFDSWIQFQCLNKFYREIQFKLMGLLSLMVSFIWSLLLIYFEMTVNLRLLSLEVFLDVG